MNSKSIEGFERYLICADGTVYDTKRKRTVSTWIDTVGYKQCYLYDEKGEKHSKRIHRFRQDHRPLRPGRVLPGCDPHLEDRRCAEAR